VDRGPCPSRRSEEPRSVLPSNSMRRLAVASLHAFNPTQEAFLERAGVETGQTPRGYRRRGCPLLMFEVTGEPRPAVAGEPPECRRGLAPERTARRRPMKTCYSGCLRVRSTRGSWSPGSVRGSAESVLVLGRVRGPVYVIESRNIVLLYRKSVLLPATGKSLL